MAGGTIRITGAREHNLKNLTLEIPRDRLVVVTGLSGSGKSSLAFDTIYAEGQRKYVESLSAYARQFLDQLRKPEIDAIEGLSPTIAIEQRSAGGERVVRHKNSFSMLAWKQRKCVSRKRMPPAQYPLSILRAPTCQPASRLACHPLLKESSGKAMLASCAVVGGRTDSWAQ